MKGGEEGMAASGAIVVGLACCRDTTTGMSYSSGWTKREELTRGGREREALAGGIR